MRKHLLFLILLVTGCISSFAAEPSGTLPVLYINIDNGAEVVTKEPYLNAVYWLDPKGVTGMEAFGSQESPLKTKIKGRGNYTFTGFDKKPYRLKLDKKAALCGLKSSKHWGLLAHADDNRGFLRNAIGFKASELVGLPWTPKQYPVELVVNGTYRGLYFLTQIIRIDSDRVNITKWGEEDENGVALDKWIEGGTLVELDNYPEEAQIQIYNNGAPEPLRFTYDKSVDPGFEPDGYINWLKSSLGTVNDLILNGDRNSSALWDLVDIDDLARFIVVQEFMDNYESFHGSCYIYREKGDGEKWHFSPVWDFGSAFQRSHPNHPCFEQSDGNMHYNHWVLELLQFPALKEKIAQYWAILKDQRADIDTFAADFINQIKSAAAKDKERWPQYGNDNLDGKLNEVKGFLNASTSYLNRAYSVPDPDEGPEFCLVGSFNTWAKADPNYKFTKQNGVYVYTCTNAIQPIEGQEFGWKIKEYVDNWNLSFGKGNSDITINTEYSLQRSDNNLTTPIPAGATLIFKYVENGTSTLKIVPKSEDDPIPPTPTPQPDIEFYLSGEFNGWASRDPAYKFTYEPDRNRFVYNVTETIHDKKWKIKDDTDNWEVNFGANGSVALQYNQPYTGVVGGTNFTNDIPAGSRFVLTYNPENISGVFIIQTEWPTDEYCKTVRFIDAHSEPWEQVYVQAWNGDDTSERYTAGWPGEAMSRETVAMTLADDAHTVAWTHTFNPEKYVGNIKVSFSNGNTGDDNNIAESDLNDEHVRSDFTTIVLPVTPADGLTFYAEQGALIIRSDRECPVQVVDLTGHVRTYELIPGTTIINLPAGIYIVNGHKVIL
ncbi:MAG: CotH kinase family protein [Muribaculaceae bacterium]|nr:CotH kinase family protein [Muribaculaceae bacterium]